MKGGTAALVKAIVDDGGYEVRMGLPSSASKAIRTMRWSPTAYDDKQISAAYVVCALPVNVIGDVEFSPALSKGKQAAYKEKHTGVNGLMFNVEVKGDIGNVSGMAASNQPLNYFAVYKRNSHPHHPQWRYQ